MHPAQPENIASITLHDLDDVFDISVRTFNICEKYGLIEVSKLLVFYSKHGDFQKLTGAGRKTNEELEKICRYYLRQGQMAAFQQDAVESPSEEQKQIASLEPSNLF